MSPKERSAVARGPVRFSLAISHSVDQNVVGLDGDTSEVHGLLNQRVLSLSSTLVKNRGQTSLFSQMRKYPRPIQGAWWWWVQLLGSVR